MLRKTRCLLQFNNIVTLFFDFITNNQKELFIDAGIFNGSNLDNQKNAWFSSPAYSARLQYFPIYGLAIIPSVQHQLMAGREASYTSFDFGVYYEWNGFLFEAEYLRKFYAKNAFDDCDAVNTMAIYKQKLKREKSFIKSISYLLRYDYMDNHSDGKQSFVETALPLREIKRGLILTDAQRHRMTLGLTFSIRNIQRP